MLKINCCIYKENPSRDFHHQAGPQLVRPVELFLKAPRDRPTSAVTIMTSCHSLIRGSRYAVKDQHSQTFVKAGEADLLDLLGNC